MQLISRFIKKVFGDIQWSKPAWCASIARFGLRNLLFLLFVLGAMLAAGIWYCHLPTTKLIAAQFSELETPALSEEPTEPAALTVRFGFLHGDRLTTQSVIPISTQANQILPEKAITLSPDLAGTWR